MGLQWFLGHSFAVWGLFASLFGLPLQQFVGLDTVKEIQTAGAVFDVFNTDGDTLGQNTTPHPLVDNHANGMFGHVENTTSLAMVGFMGHTFLEGTVSLK